MTGLEFTRNQKLALIAIVGLIAIGISIKLVRNASSPVYGGVVLSEAGADGVNVVTSDSDSTRAGGASGTVIFQVAGCVNSPNVFSLPRGSRIVDAIKAAGGLKPGADIQSLNLAAKIEDGIRIFIPSAQSGTGPATSAAATQTAMTPATASTVGSKSKSESKSASSDKLHNPGDGVVNINTADATELQRLPGVGPSTAQAILDYRSQIRRFSSAAQLDDVKGIGLKKLEKMKPFVAL